MTLPTTISIAALKKEHSPLAPSQMYARTAQYTGYTHLYDLEKQPPFTIVPAGAEIDIPKRSWFEILDHESDALRFYTHTKARVSGPALVRITEEDAEVPTLGSYMRKQVPKNALVPIGAWGVFLLVITIARFTQSSLIGWAEAGWFGTLLMVAYVVSKGLDEWPVPRTHAHGIRPKPIAAFATGAPTGARDSDPAPQDADGPPLPPPDPLS